MAAAQPRDAFAYFINVLVVIGIPAGPVNRALSRYAIDSSPDGVMVNVFKRRCVPAPLPRSLGNPGEAGRCRRLAFGRC
jgi:hypothetical protein